MRINFAYNYLEDIFISIFSVDSSSLLKFCRYVYNCLFNTNLSLEHGQKTRVEYAEIELEL